MDKTQLISLMKNEGFDEKIINAFEKVKREDFVGEGMKKLAYENIALPISESETISQPSTIAIALSMLNRSYISVLVTTKMGMGMLALAIILMIAGIMWILKIVKIEY